MGGSRIPGPVGDVLISGDDLQPPGAGLHDPGSVGLDTGGTALAATTVEGWPRDITWDEFREVSSNPTGGSEDAYISARFEYPWSWENEGRHYRVNQATVRMQVDERESWVVRSRQSAPLLSHEQGHYDLTGLMARDLASALARVTASSESGLRAEVERIASHYRRHSARLNAQYDRETVHGSNQREQDRWKQRISDAMANGTQLAPRP